LVWRLGAVGMHYCYRGTRCRLLLLTRQVNNVSPRPTSAGLPTIPVFVIYPVSLAIDSIVIIISSVTGFRSLVVTGVHIKLRCYDARSTTHQIYWEILFVGYRGIHSFSVLFWPTITHCTATPRIEADIIIICDGMVKWSCRENRHFNNNPHRCARYPSVLPVTSKHTQISLRNSHASTAATCP